MKFLLRKRWNVANRLDADERLDLVKNILTLRGFNNDLSSDDFLEPGLKIYHDPFLLNDMDKAVSEILKVIRDNGKMIVFGDYDADGITATAILCHYLRSTGADVGYMIPERLTEGYGLSLDSIDRICEIMPDLVITVDNGIASADEVRILKERHIKVIITDHHECKEILPDALAVIDPKRVDNIYPFKDLAGAGIALKLVQALSVTSGAPDSWRRYLDVCTLGTVADMVSLTDENRMIVYHGLKIINMGGNEGIRALLKVSTGKNSDKITSATLGYTIAPRINAAGRVGDSTKAVELLMESDPLICEEISICLAADNTKRQEIETSIFDQARRIIDERYDPASPQAIVVFDKCWHLGVLGIVASKLAEYTGRTVFVFGGEGDLYKGSVRSGDGMPVLEAIRFAEEYVEKYGGHSKAAGLTVHKSKIDLFTKAVEVFSADYHANEIPVPQIDIDFEIPFEMITYDNALSVEYLEPFGEGNRQPLFVCMGVKVLTIFSLSEGKHSKLLFGNETGQTFEGLAFGVTPPELPFAEGDKADIVFTMKINQWRGNSSVQVILKDFRKNNEEDLLDISSVELDKAFNENFDLVTEMTDSDDANFIKTHFPSSEDYYTVYGFLVNRFADDSVLCDIKSLRDIINAGTGISGSSFKIRRMLDVFSEVGLIEIVWYTDDLFRLKVADPGRRVSLSDSTVYRRLREIKWKK